MPKAILYEYIARDATSRKPQEKLSKASYDSSGQHTVVNGKERGERGELFCSLN